MGRPRIRDYVEQSIRVPVTWFTPPEDHHSIQFKLGVWARRLFAADFRWTVARATEFEAQIHCWYDVYSPEYSKRVDGRRDWHTDERAREGTDRWRFELELKLEGKRTELGTIVWHLLCPQCTKPRKYLYVTPRNRELRCRKCHHLRYLSQDPPPGAFDLLLREAREIRKLQEMALGLRPPPQLRGWGDG